MEVFQFPKGVLDPYPHPVELLLAWVQVFAFEGEDCLLASHEGLVPNYLLPWSELEKGWPERESDHEDFRELPP